MCSPVCQPNVSSKFAHVLYEFSFLSHSQNEDGSIRPVFVLFVIHLSTKLAESIHTRCTRL